MDNDDAPDWQPARSAVGLTDGIRAHSSVGQLFEVKDGQWRRLRGLERAQAELELAIAACEQARTDLRETERKVSRARDQLDQAKRAAAPPVDRTQQELVGGGPVTGDHRELKANGQQKDYVVLSAAERAKGFKRPYRDAYRHLKCGKITTMGRAIAETYARDPGFYSGTFCVHCGKHFPIGEHGEFTWYEMDGREGPKVGT